jgi:hypothetical protein
MADLDPDLWFDQKGDSTPNVVTTGVAGTGKIEIVSGDGTNGIEGLNLTAAEDATDFDNGARIMKAIQEFQYTYQETLATVDKPTTMVITRAASTSGTTLYVTYSYRYEVDTESLEVGAE